MDPRCQEIFSAEGVKLRGKRKKYQKNKYDKKALKSGFRYPQESDFGAAAFIQFSPALSVTVRDELLIISGAHQRMIRLPYLLRDLLRNLKTIPPIDLYSLQISDHNVDKIIHIKLF